jgi:hypothetical protein
MNRSYDIAPINSARFVGARFSLLQQALHLSVAEFQQRAARLREQQAAIDAAAAAAAEAAAGAGGAS